MKSLLFRALFLLLAAPLAVQAQSASVQGRVESAEGRPLPSAVVELRSAADSAVVTGAITNADGVFRIAPVTPGRYTVRATLLGYEAGASEAVTVSAGGGAVAVATIRLQPAAIAIEGVDVTAERGAIVTLADRTVYSTADLAAAAGGSATDALRSVPELEVDIEGRVTSRGTTPRIHINGRPAAMEGEALQRYLEQLPADRIASVEVIPNPSSRYEAEGTGGIVNIVLRQDVSLGLSGSVSANANSRNRNGLSTRLNYQEGRLTVFAGGNLNRSVNNFSSIDVRENFLTTPVTSLRQENRGDARGHFFSGDLTAELRRGRVGTLWLQARAFLNRNDGESAIEYIHMDADGHTTSRYERLSVFDYDGGSSAVTVGYRHAVQSQREEWSVELRRSGNDAHRFNRHDQISPVHEADPLDMIRVSQWNDEDVFDLSAQFDVIRPFGEAGRVEFGVRSAMRNSDDQQNREDHRPHELETDRTRFDYSEQIHAVYTSVNRDLLGLSLQGGLRLEHAVTDARLPLAEESFDGGYTALYPSLNVARSLGEGTQLRASYSRRVERPPLFYLNPTDRSADPLNRFVGNPHLKPRYTHSFQFDVSRTGSFGSLRVAPFHRMLTDTWEEFRSMDANGVSTITFRNTSSSQVTGVTTTLSLRGLGPVSGSLGTTASSQRREGFLEGAGAERLPVRFSGNSNLNFRASPTLSAQLSANYFPPRDLPQGTISAMVFSTVSARYQLPGGRANVSLAVTDPLKLQRQTFTTRDGTHTQRSESTFDSRMLRMNVSYSFGRPPQSTRRQTSPEDAEPAAAEPAIR